MEVKAIGGITAAALGILGTTAVQAQPGMGWRGSGGWGMGAQYQRMFDPGTVETLSGVVTSIDKMVLRKGMSSGIHLQLKAETGTLPVHLGPAWFVERLDTRIDKGDKLEIKGSRVTIEGKPAIIAAEVTKGDSVLVLRDASGVPAWAGWRKR